MSHHAASCTNTKPDGGLTYPCLFIAASRRLTRHDHAIVGFRPCGLAKCRVTVFVLCVSPSSGSMAMSGLLGNRCLIPIAVPRS